MDADGDQDLFIGARSIPVSYGIAPDSYLLINDGKGHFRTAEHHEIFEGLGMVTDAAWLDADNDQDLDLLVVGDWMPITIIRQENDQFSRRSIPNSGGWWNTIEVADLDNDGNLDFIAGNFGQNSNLQPTVSEPVRLYVSDFDRNLSRDPILTYYRQGQEFIFFGFDELTKQLNFLKKKYLTYHDFADQSVSDIFGKEELMRSRRLQAENFHSVVGMNNGAGNFHLQDLPFTAQLGPIQSILIEDFDRDGWKDALVAGNLFEVQPAIGRQDALPPTIFQGRGDGTFSSAPDNLSPLVIDGQIRDLKMIETTMGIFILVARNNDSVVWHFLNEVQ